jgi:hypothetical protein
MDGETAHWIIIALLILIILVLLLAPGYLRRP